MSTTPKRHNGWRELLVSWVYPDGEIAQLIRERDHHLAAAEGRWRDVYLMHAGRATEGGFEMVLKSPVGIILAEHMVQCLRSIGAENWVEVEVTHPDAGQLVFTIQRKRGQTPGQLVAALKAELSELKEQQTLAKSTE